MRPVLSPALALVVVIASSPASAADEIPFDIAPGRLDGALLDLARQARVSINVDDPALRSVHSRGLHGRYSLEGALRRLLRGTGFTFRIESGAVVRIVRQDRNTPRAVATPRRDPAPHRAAPPTTTNLEPIVVTASKRHASLADYPGSAYVAELEQADAFRFGGQAGELMLRRLPNLSSTDLGPGRNKIFIRGIADSSFNGQNQATVSQYLGETRLIYSAPDPELALYDVARLEVLEGPQGTLYGAGSLGGVIRVVPNQPDPGSATIAGTAALSTTDGELGDDMAAVANLPIGNTSAVRLVGYQIVRPGYIDDPGRNLSDINRTSIAGVRATLRFEPLAGLKADLGFVGQNLSSRDGQYTNSGTSALTRRSAIAQPFDNDYRLGFATLRKAVGAAELVSNTSYVDHSIDSAFDATQPGDTEPRLFREDMTVSLLTHETRISGAGEAFSGWVGGIAVARNVNRERQFLGAPDAPAILSDQRSTTLDAAAFGEATVPLGTVISLTGGLRAAYFHQTGELGPANANVADFEPKRTDWRLLPTVALSWRPHEGLLLYARYVEGYRPGSQRIVAQGGEVSAARFEPDEIGTREVGLRFGSRPGARLSGSIAFATSRWKDIQADLVTEDGFPFVANIGSGYVRYASANLAWRPTRAFALEANAFLTSSHLDRPAPEFANAQDRDLPNIADSGWRASARYSRPIGGADLQLDANLIYVGTSSLAIGAPFQRSQGDYYDTSVGVRIGLGRLGLSIDLDNLLDSRANRFSYGDPFTFLHEDQRTPLRPRSLRVGIDASF